MQIELDWLKKWNLYSPQATAIKDGDTGREISYAQFHQLSSRGAQVLSEKFGIRKGDRVAVLSLNELEYVFLFFALQRLGATLVPMNFRLTQREVDHVISDCKPKLIVYQNEFSTLVESLQPPLAPEFRYLLTGENSFASDILTEGASYSSFHSRPETTAMVIYTSGATGLPVCHDHARNALLEFDQYDFASEYFSDRFYGDLPPVVSYWWLECSHHSVYSSRRQSHLLEKIRWRSNSYSHRRKNATLLFGVPTTMDMMARSEKFKSVNLASLRYAIVGGEPMPVELIQTWHDKGVPVRQGYGLLNPDPMSFR